MQKSPRIGEAYSQKIIKGAPYPKKDRLVSNRILPQVTYDKIEDLIIARQKQHNGDTTKSRVLHSDAP